MKHVTRNDVVVAYTQWLSLIARRIILEKQGQEETEAQQEERLAAMEKHDTLQLQYLGRLT